MIKIAVLVLLFTNILAAHLPAAEPEGGTDFLHGQQFGIALTQPVSASWDNVTLRPLVQRLSESQRVSVLLDCRVDPTTPLQLVFDQQPLLKGLEELATRVDAVASVPGYVVYLGPRESASWLRTAIEQRAAELDDLAIDERRQLDLLTRKSIAWADLTSPREILQQISQQHDVEIAGTDEIPHDLWAGGTLPYATVNEALSIVLIQLALDFRWGPDGRSVMLVPWQQPALLERRYRPRARQSAGKTLAEWRDRIPDLDARVDRGEILVRGRAEDQERVRHLVAPPRESAPSTGDPAPLRNRRFTLRVENAPIEAIFRELEKSGIVFEYDAAALKEAGIDLRTPVSLDLQQADADDFLRAVLAPVAVQFSIDNRTVRLQPKRD